MINVFNKMDGQISVKKNQSRHLLKTEDIGDSTIKEGTRERENSDKHLRKGASASLQSFIPSSNVYNPDRNRSE